MKNVPEGTGILKVQSVNLHSSSEEIFYILVHTRREKIRSSSKIHLNCRQDNSTGKQNNKLVFVDPQ